LGSITTAWVGPPPLVVGSSHWHGPVGPALALEALVVEVLVEVEQREDALLGQLVHALGDLGQVGVVVAAGGGLDALVDHAQPHGVEALAPQEAGVRGVEAGRGGGVGRALEDHVHAVQHHHPAASVGQPAALLAERRGGRGGRSRGNEREQADGHPQRFPEPSHGWRSLTDR
jgi:hypothetical protein